MRAKPERSARPSKRAGSGAGAGRRRSSASTRRRVCRYETRRDEATRCHFCKNACLRTFIDVRASGRLRRHIVATCEKGAAADDEAMRGRQGGARRGQSGEPESGRGGVARGLEAAPAGERRRPAAGARLERQVAPAPRARRAPPDAAHRHSTRPEPVRVRAALQRVLREPRRRPRQHRLFGLHVRCALPGGRWPRRHRPVLSLEGRRRARLQPAVREAPANAARLRLPADVRRAPIAARGARAAPTRARRPP